MGTLAALEKVGDKTRRNRTVDYAMVVGMVIMLFLLGVLVWYVVQVYVEMEEIVFQARRCNCSVFCRGQALTAWVEDPETGELSLPGQGVDWSVGNQSVSEP